MSTHIRTWGIALTAVVAFAVPHLSTHAGTTTAMAVTASTAQAPAAQASLPVVEKTLNLKITAYTSTEEETDDTPFITADGSYVHDGVVATNLLPFGTKIMIPSLFGDKVFTVNDRMNKKFQNNLDIWMADRTDAIIFGARTAKVVVLQNVAEAAKAATVDVAVITDSNAAAMATKAMAISSKSQGPSVRQL